MATKLSLNRAIVEGLEPPATGRMTISDARVRGLVLTVTAKGARSFSLYRKVRGKPVRVFICTWPDLSVEQIRRRAEQINEQIARGEDPTAQRRADRQEWTLRQLFEDFMELHAKPRKKSWATDEWLFNRHLAHWASKRLKEITPGSVQELHAKIGKDVGVVPANRTRSLVSVLFEHARRRGQHTGDNPTKGVRRFPEKSHERYLTEEELPKVLAALEASDNQLMADLVRLALFSGARRGNLQSAHWDEFDMAAGVWTIPATKAKAGRKIDVPLTNEAIEVLQRRHEATGGTGYVFPSSGKRGHVVEVKSYWQRICKAAGVEGVRFHDLRHTSASWLVARGVGLQVVGRLLGHQSVKTTERYAHLDLRHLREALATSTAAMAAAKPK